MQLRQCGEQNMSDKSSWAISAAQKNEDTGKWIRLRELLRLLRTVSKKQSAAKR